MTGFNSVRKDERGMGAMVIIIAVVVIAVIGLVGWQLTKKKDDTTVSSSSSAPAAGTVNAACLKVYNDKDLCKFETSAANFDKVSYTAVVTGTDSDGKASSLSLQSDGKGNTSFTTGSGAESYSAVTIGNTNYYKTGDATSWTKLTTTPSDSSTDPAKDIKTDFSTDTTPAAQQIKYVKMGKEACGKQTCFKYQVIDPSTPNDTVYVWFGTSDYLMHQYYTKGADGTSTFVISYGPVNIKTPSPVAADTSAADAAAAAAAAEAAAAQDGN